MKRRGHIPSSTLEKLANQLSPAGSQSLSERSTPKAGRVAIRLSLKGQIVFLSLVIAILLSRYSPQGSFSFFQKNIAALSNVLVIGTANNRDTALDAALDVSVPFLHIVNSRFQQHDKNLTALGEARLELFETFCLPSMVHQTIQPKNNSNLYQFIWIIKIDPKLDLRLKKKMVQLLKPYPNFFLVGSNNNYGASFGGGSWRGGKAGNDVLYGNEMGPSGDGNGTLSQYIYTGDIPMLQLAHKLRDERIILETRLDADDGLPGNYLENIQLSAVKHLSTGRERHLDKNDTKIVFLGEKLRWYFWCISQSFNWHPTVLVNGFSSNQSVVNEHPGLVTLEKYSFCLTPGLTSGIAVGINSSEVPRYSHYSMIKNLRKKKPENFCGTKKKKQVCVEVLDEVLAIRARTPTSDGMKGLEVLKENKKNAVEWNNLFKMFGIQKERVAEADHHIYSNLVLVLKDNLAGQCTHLKGKFCSASKMATQKMIDEAVKARMTLHLMQND